MCKDFTWTTDYKDEVMEEQKGAYFDDLMETDYDRFL